MIPLFASLVVAPNVPVPLGLLDQAPIVSRAVAPWHTPEDCVLSEELARLAPEARDVEGLHRAMRCTRTGAVEPLHAIWLFDLGQAALSAAAARVAEDPVGATRRMADVFVLGRELGYSSLTPAAAGMVLQRDALRQIAAIPALGLPLEDRRTIARLLGDPADRWPTTLALEATWMERYTGASWDPRWWWGLSGVNDAVALLEPAAGSRDALAEAARRCLEVDADAWLPNPGLRGVCVVVGSAVEAQDERDRALDTAFFTFFAGR